jgi:hypothetical protein
VKTLRDRDVSVDLPVGRIQGGRIGIQYIRPRELKLPIPRMNR